MRFFIWNPFWYLRKEIENDEMQILFSMDLIYQRVDLGI